MAGEQSTLSPLEQMNQLLTDKQALIDREMEKLSQSKRELIDFQNELSQKVQEIKSAQEELKSEREALDAEWKKLQEAKDNLQSSMEAVLAEKVKQEEKSLKELRLQLEGAECVDASSTAEDEFNLDALRASIGMDVDAAMVVEPKGTSINNAIPELFQALEKEITKSYSKWTKLELLPERYCLQSGDKEIRFFDVSQTNKVPCVQIIVFTRNTKNEGKLLSNLAGAARILPEWSVNTENNQIVCTMQFTADTKVSAVLKKCSDFMKTYLS